MTQYILRRFLWAIPVLLGASFLVFWSIRWVPGDPAIAIAGELATPELVEKVRAELGLDQPLPIQYGIYLGRMLRGDMGTSVRSGLPVFEEIRIRLPRTLQLTFFSLLFAAAIGIPIGVLSATRQHLDRRAEHDLRLARRLDAYLLAWPHADRLFRADASFLAGLEPADLTADRRRHLATPRHADHCARSQFDGDPGA